MRLPTHLQLAILPLLPVCRGAIYEAFDALPRSKFDYVIVGAGAGGSVLANRLSEDSHISVLLVEAGSSNAGVLNSIVPMFLPLLNPDTPYDWNYTTTPQGGLDGRSINFGSGHMLGGSTSVNYMAYTRGSSEDWDRYARLTGDEGWSWRSIQKYLRRKEKWTPPADNHNTAGQFDPRVHGSTGINSVSLPGFPHPFDSRVIAATKENSSAFPWNLDINSGRPLGVVDSGSILVSECPRIDFEVDSRFWRVPPPEEEQRFSLDSRFCDSASILDPESDQNRCQNRLRIDGESSTLTPPNDSDGGQRSSAATSYLGPDFISRPNLHVLVNSRVTKLVQTGEENGKPALRSILLLSGIGDKNDLTALGIRTVLDNPSVGRNLTDHPLLINQWYANSTGTFDALQRNVSFVMEELAAWEQTQKGLLVNSILSHLIWSRLPDHSFSIPDPSAGPNSAHYELILANGWGRATPIPATGNFIAIGTSISAPTSVGEITLRTSNPFDQPNINPNLIGTDFDVFVMTEAVRAARAFFSAKAWNGYVLGEFDDLAVATDDAKLEQYIRKNSASILHPVGTASMSSQAATFGVVDPDLVVKGISGLRIADASVLPLLPSAHTQVPVYVVAERAADLLKTKYGLLASYP
ncbi:mitochondrial choline dehydrogenase [Favolaschia claudopus]|uniref:Mitochondrial choline dehydrogenase n=1 Tax=Favolaschia claudopus TaxID=2862362 RepID=A0AAW0AWG8_9AGAR